MKSKIVIVDDQYSSRMSVMLHIEDMGLHDRVVLLQNGKEAVEYFKEKLDQLRLQPMNDFKTIEHPVVLLLIDLNMPVMSGNKAVKIIKKNFK